MAGCGNGELETKHCTRKALNYPMTAADVSNEGNLLLSIPCPRWLTIRRVCIFGFSLVIALAAGFLVLTDLVHHAGMTGTQRALLMVFAGLLLFNALFKSGPALVLPEAASRDFQVKDRVSRSDAALGGSRRVSLGAVLP